MNSSEFKRRNFIKQFSTGAAASLVLGSSSILTACGNNAQSTAVKDAIAKTSNDFEISLAQWSLHKAFFNKDLDVMDFATIASKDFGIQAIELVNQFYRNQATKQSFLTDFKQRADDAGVQIVLVMCDGLGNLGDADPVSRMTAVENHYQWVDAIKYFGGHSIRVNAAGQGTSAQVSENAIDGLGKLSDYAQTVGVNVIVENHGGYSSDGKWLSNVISSVGKRNCGTLPDFGNFCIESGEEGCEIQYDRYVGMKDLMPYAKGVSAKSYEFDSLGNEVNMDFAKIMEIVKQSGYQGYVGIEYEGNTLSESEGIKATKSLLERVFSEV